MSTSKTFTYQQENPEYVIKLKKRNYWWLLLFLLLLLPLLLLIHFEKDVTFMVKTSQGQTAISNADVKFIYQEHELVKLSGFKFFSTDTVNLSGKTDKDGKITFQHVRYSLFSKLFRSQMLTLVKGGSECFYADSLKPAFFSLKDKEINPLTISYRSNSLEFLVVDRDDNQPIPRATVNCKTEISGINATKTDSTNANGNVVIKEMPYCGNATLIGSAPGYESDTVIAPVKNLFGNQQLRTLKLKPLKRMVQFLVKNLKTKQPVPDAVVTLKIKNKSVAVRTNTNGVGKGAFEDVLAIAEMTLMAQKAYYYDTIKTDKVENFIKQNEEYRTLYLRTRLQNIVFRNIDASTKNPITGVKNVISVNGVQRPDAEISNSNGTFTVSGVLNEDKISITATKTGYEDNNTAIQNKLFSSLMNGAQDQRDIPMKSTPPVTPPPTDPPKQNEQGLQGKSGDLRINLQWSTTDDLDLYVTDPCNNQIFYRKRQKSCSEGVGTLDVDANALFVSPNPQENVYWQKPAKGAYVVYVHFFKKNQPNLPVNFNITIIDKGERQDFPGVALKPGDKYYVTTHTVK